MLRLVTSGGAQNDSLFLFGAPSFVQGITDAADLFGDTIGFNESLNPNQADYLALKADWRRVGDEIREAIDLVASETKTR